MLNINNLNLYINNSHILKDLSLNIDKGEIIGLIGKSGSGKSTLISSILKLFKSYQDVKINGKIIFDKHNILTTHNKTLCKIRGNNISLIPQDSLDSLDPLMSVYKQIAEILTIHNIHISQKEIKDRIYQLLDYVNLSNIKNRLDVFPHQLSGGQRQRVLSAIAIANKPKLLLADEPTSSLDMINVNYLINILKKLHQNNGTSILFVSHDTRVVSKIVDYAYVIDEGKIIDKKSQVELKKQASVKISVEKNNFTNKNKLLQISNLDITFKGNKFLWLKKENKNIINKISFELHEKETLVITGPSGCGKTTTIMAMMRLLPYNGDIILNGTKINPNNKTQLKEFRNNVQIVFQDPFSSLSPKMLVGDIIREGLDVQGKYSYAEQIKIANNSLKLLNLPKSYINKYPHELSGGEKQRVAIARSISFNPKCILLDEPTSALDEESQQTICKLLNNLQKELNISYIICTHDVNIITSMAHSLLVLNNGIVEEYGKFDDLAKNSTSQYLNKIIELATV